MITTGMGYAGCVYEIPAGFESDWKGVYLQAAPPERTSMAIMYPIENNRWLLGFCATAPHRLPKDEAALLDALQQLPSPMIYNALKQAKPCTPIEIYYPPGNRLCHYETLKRQPERFLVLGDASLFVHANLRSRHDRSRIGGEDLRCLFAKPCRTTLTQPNWISKNISETTGTDQCRALDCLYDSRC